jgi:hypothetical protein
MQQVSCDEIWFNRLNKSSVTELLVLCGIRMRDSHMHVLFGHNLGRIDEFGHAYNRFEKLLPGGVHVLGIGIVGGENTTTHSSLQRCFSNITQPCVVIDFTISASKSNVRVMEGGLLKPFNGTLQIRNIPIHNHVMTVPVNLCLPIGELTRNDLHDWFRESVHFTSRSQIESPDIFEQRALVRLTDYHRPTVPCRRISGNVKIVAVVFAESDPLHSLCESFVRRMTSEEPFAQHLIYIGEEMCESNLLFSLCSRDGTFLSMGLRLWNNELNVIKRESVTPKLTYMHVVVTLIGIVISFYVSRYYIR